MLESMFVFDEIYVIYKSRAKPDHQHTRPQTVLLSIYFLLLIRLPRTSHSKELDAVMLLTEEIADILDLIRHR